MVLFLISSVIVWFSAGRRSAQCAFQSLRIQYPKRHWRRGYNSPSAYLFGRVYGDPVDFMMTVAGARHPEGVPMTEPRLWLALPLCLCSTLFCFPPLFPAVSVISSLTFALSFDRLQYRPEVILVIVIITGLNLMATPDPANTKRSCVPVVHSSDRCYRSLCP